jgi:hypothetical protein
MLPPPNVEKSMTPGVTSAPMVRRNPVPFVVGAVVEPVQLQSNVVVPEATLRW